jgi:hypothetical protein
MEILRKVAMLSVWLGHKEILWNFKNKRCRRKQLGTNGSSAGDNVHFFF